MKSCARQSNDEHKRILEILDRREERKQENQKTITSSNLSLKLVLTASLSLDRDGLSSGLTLERHRHVAVFL